MGLDPLWAFFHLFFAFSFVGSLVVAEWNGRAARAASDWSQRAVLFEIVSRSSRIAGLGALLATGVFGNLLSVARGYRMATDGWMHWANGLWLVAVLVMALVCLPGAARLAALARAASTGGAADGYPRALARWRLGNLALSVFYLAQLGLMVFRWRG